MLIHVKTEVLTTEHVIPTNETSASNYIDPVVGNELINTCTFFCTRIKIEYSICVFNPQKTHQ